MHSTDVRIRALLGTLLFLSMQVFPHSDEPVRSSVIGQKFDTTKISVIDKLMVECRILNAHEQRLSDSCIDRVAKYFSNQPVWEQSLLYIPSLDRFETLGPALNSRTWHLVISQSDVSGDVPTWSDVFDGKVEKRQSVVEQVLQDEKCARLRKRGPIRSDSNLSDECQARELVKYAIYLDTCLTGVERINRLLVERAPIDGKTTYEKVIAAWDRRLSAEASRIAQAELHESLLHAVWSYNACLHAPLDGYVDTFGSKDWDTERVWTYVEGMTKELQRAHESAMSISARAGDSWAIQGFFVKELRRDKEYWKSLYKINPLLFHRSMTDAGISLRLTDREVVMLALNAYDL